jgi:Rhs element Vgr protein
MTVPSPLTGATALVSFTIKVAGKEIPSTFQVLSIDTWVAVNKVPKARIVIFDGNPATSNFEISDLDTFLPGKQLEIAAGYSQKDTPIFKGIIVKQGIEINQTQGSKLIVDISDEAIKMTLERKNDLFPKIRDSELIGKLITSSGLEKDVAPTNPVLEQIVQYYATDWDLMMMRAELNSFVVMVEAGKVSVKEPDTKQTPVLRVKFGESILDFNAEMDAATQYQPSAIKSITWDVAAQKLAEAPPAAVVVEEPGNVSSAELAKVFKVKKFPQQTGGAIQTPTLKEWSSAELLKSKLAKIRGYVRFQGSALAKVGKTIQLEGVGGRFNGNAFISGVHHNINEGRWLSTVDFGLSPVWFATETPDIVAPDASGQLPAIKGLQTGIVKQVSSDPDGEFRVLVNLPLLQNANKSIWARLSTFYATNKAGAVFFPEQEDEVIVGFMNQDPRYPVVLGSVYSKKLAPPAPYIPDKKNSKKAIVTKGNLEISFDDQDKIIQIKTPGKQIIKVDDKSAAISIQDSNKNTISLSKGGITLDSGSNIKITAKGNITVQAGANMLLSAKANASMEGLQVAHKAKGKFSANGALTAELTASGILTVRGTMVKIN